MDPIFEYFEIIVNRLQNPLPKGEYGERHHIYPKSLGGWNLKCNVVRLTPEEHYRCHSLLPDILKDLGDMEGYRKMVFAFGMMGRKFQNCSEEKYGELRRAYCQLTSERRRNTKMSEEQKRRISETLKQKGIVPPSRKGCPPPNKGKGKPKPPKKPRIPWNKGVHNEKTRAAVNKSWAKRKAAQHLQS